MRCLHDPRNNWRSCRDGQSSFIRLLKSGCTDNVSRWISRETGLRSDVAHDMVYPLRETHPNLHIATGMHVKHVTFDEYVLQLAVSPSLFSARPYRIST